MVRGRPKRRKAARAAASRLHPSQRTKASEADVFPVVGIGASAGGLEACKKLIGGLPAGNGMAFILVQHLDPTHESMMVDLLTGHTSMAVKEAVDGMPVERGHLYVIPPGTYLSVQDGVLHLSEPQARHGARLPFDFLLHSLAEEFGARAVCVVLSGTGADGSLGLKSVATNGGLVVAQDPDEAGYDGMPRSAIATGAVNLVLPVAEIPDALARYQREMAGTGPHAADTTENWLPRIIQLLRAKTSHDFRLYKPGTLQRRIERRMAMAGIGADDMRRYLEILQSDAGELDLLAKDLLINVTSFFRDPKVFDLLATRIVPDLIRDRTPDHPVRIWVAGCSTGEETYSLAMIFREQIALTGRNIKLQIFASDVDADAVATAREGFYPATIETDVSPARLARFFSRDDHGYKVTPELRAAVVFTVQDVLADPPFSRLDLISCRNLLIYLRPEAQTKVISLFHFALREGGILLLGSSETADHVGDHFEVISKPARLYRHIGRSRPGEVDFSIEGRNGVRPAARPVQERAPSRQATLEDLCVRLVAENHAPATLLVDRKHQCLYSLGPTDRYLRVMPHVTQDVLAMARDDVRMKLRSAIQRAGQKNERVLVTGGKLKHGGDVFPFNIDVRPVRSEGEDMFLICFVDEPIPVRKVSSRVPPRDVPRVAALEQELEATKAELDGAIRSLEISNEEQKAVNEEALSVNEEFQSTNEELLTSKEELQSLNEELTALNGQLQEALERQRTMANDLQNVLYSTHVATLFLDRDFNIRFFTPATRALFNIISSDIGRPLTDLSSLAVDDNLLTDARSVLRDLMPVEREIEMPNGVWFTRRILPYRTQDKMVDGLVITFIDITGQKHSTQALEAATRQAESANLAKSRFLAAASHDLRQPLQTLALLQGLLMTTAQGDKARKLLTKIEETLGAMSGMLNALLDINEIEVGTVHAVPIGFPIDDLLDRLKDEFSYHAEAKGLALHVVPCGVSIYSDPRLLEHMIRNLLSNALKYTTRGKVLLGCRRHAGMLSIEIWDTGIGIPESELQTIFEEYHQLDNPARDRNLGLGLGLSITKLLGDILGHRIRVHSRPGKGSVFVIEVELFLDGAGSRPPPPILPGATGRRAPAAGQPVPSWSSKTTPTYVSSSSFSSKTKVIM